MRSAKQIPAERRYKVRLIAQPVHTTLTSAPDTKVTVASATLTLTVLTPVTATTTTSTQTMPMTQTITETIPITLHNLTKGKFDAVGKPQPELNSLIPPVLEDVPQAPVFKN